MKETGPGAERSGGEASLLRARLSAILDITLDPLILVRPLYDATGQVTDFVIADMNGSHSRAGGDPLTAECMHLPKRSPELFSMYCRVLQSGATESVRRVWIAAHPDDATSASGWADVRATPVAGDLVVSWRGVDAEVPDPFGVLFVDLDQFKAINDVHGHAVGRRRVRRPGATIARPGGAAVPGSTAPVDR